MEEINFDSRTIDEVNDNREYIVGDLVITLYENVKKASTSTATEAEKAALPEVANVLAKILRLY